MAEQPPRTRFAAVARFNPEGLSARRPTGQHMRPFTVYQWTAGDFTVDIPARIEGPVWMQGALHLARRYPSTGARHAAVI